MVTTPSPTPSPPKNKHRFNDRFQIWPSILTLAMTLTLKFHGQIFDLNLTIHFDFGQDLDLKLSRSNILLMPRGKMIRLSRNEKPSMPIDCQTLYIATFLLSWLWPWPYILKVKYSFCYISGKWSDCHETNTELFDLTLRMLRSHYNDLFRICHDDVIKWKHFPRYWPFMRGIHRSPVNSPHKGQWRGVLMFSLICAWMNGWVNNREAGDLRRHRAHYNATVMSLTSHMSGMGGSIATIQKSNSSIMRFRVKLSDGT